MLRSLAILSAFAIMGAPSNAQNAPPASSPSDTPTSEQAASSEPSAPAATVNVSQVRIVRLSQVKGQVQLDRNTDQKFEEAFVNLPIVAGEKLKTQTGLAEVEFEDNSSIRLTPNSLVEFPVLGRDASGATNTSVRLLSGSLYVSRAATKGTDGFTINAGSETITLNPGGHLRVDLGAPASKLVVFKGTAMVSDASGTVMVGKNKTITFDPAARSAPVFAHNEGAATFDSWDKNSADYHQQRSSFTNSSSGIPYAYGTSDLGYYGSFSNMGGCGSMWRPYLASAAWNPYGSGVWSYYPGAGYSWVSPYPWGWTPYHSGSWEFCNSTGSWGWRPNGSWSGLDNVAGLRAIPGRSRLLPPPLPRPGQSTLVGVNLKELPISHTDASRAFVLRNDSAGLGVPRGTFNLGKLSTTAMQRGAVTTQVSEVQAERGMIPATHPASMSLSAARGGGGAVSASTSSGGSFATASHSSMASASSAMGGASHGGGGGGSSSGGGHH